MRSAEVSRNQRAMRYLVGAELLNYIVDAPSEN
jgi:hypothetical protein